MISPTIISPNPILISGNEHFIGAPTVEVARSRAEHRQQRLNHGKVGIRRCAVYSVALAHFGDKLAVGAVGIGDKPVIHFAHTKHLIHKSLWLEDEQAIPLDQILVQPFMATDDPRVLGIEPIPNIAERISAMIEKYRKETIGASPCDDNGSVRTDKLCQALGLVKVNFLLCHRVLMICKMFLASRGRGQVYRLRQTQR